MYFYCFLAAKFPSLRLVVDHISKPYLSAGEKAGLTGWKEDMARAAQYPNVYCKGGQCNGNFPRVLDKQPPKITHILPKLDTFIDINWILVH